MTDSVFFFVCGYCKNKPKDPHLATAKIRCLQIHHSWPGSVEFPFRLKGPKHEIFDCLDFHYFFTIKSLWVDDLGT